MQKYVNQLIEDIILAKNNIPVKPYYQIPPEMEGIEYIVEWENNPEKKMSEWFKIDSHFFPHSDKLSTNQMQQITDALLKLWAAFNFSADFPNGLPVLYKYRQLVKTLDVKVQWTSEGISCFTTWCDIEPKTCPFPEEFCDCKDLPDDDFDINGNSDVLPF